jgi:putative DNA primase/helicase
MDATNNEAARAGNPARPSQVHASQRPHFTARDDDVERARDALRFIPAGGHDERVRIACALKSALGETARDLWDEWRGERGNDEAGAVWRSIRADGGVTIATLYHEARANGWRDDGHYARPTAAELAERKRVADERAARDEAQRDAERKGAAERARAIWGAAGEARGDHPYLTRKRLVSIPTLREIDASKAADILGYLPRRGDDPLMGRLLVVPVKVNGALSTVELIDESGRKSALRGGAKAGGCWQTGALPDGGGDGVTVLIGEGMATVHAASTSTGHVGVAALANTNLHAVAVGSLHEGACPAGGIVSIGGCLAGVPGAHRREAGGEIARSGIAVPVDHCRQRRAQDYVRWLLRVGAARV